jgi:hypothetical protein
LKVDPCQEVDDDEFGGRVRGKAKRMGASGKEEGGDLVTSPRAL